MQIYRGETTKRKGGITRESIPASCKFSTSDGSWPELHRLPNTYSEIASFLPATMLVCVMILQHT
ncbi:hypothetical protein M758_8G168400 [Ceratodon purpureus]|nr:hypothetical protein M758_8G168400 [Ceratodon purpureus]